MRQRPAGHLQGLREERGTYSDDDALRDVGCQRVVLVLRMRLQGYHEHEIPAKRAEGSGHHPALGPADSASTKLGTSPLLVLSGKPLTELRNPFLRPKQTPPST